MMFSDFRSNAIPYKCLSDLLPFLVDDTFGIIRRLYELPRKADMPDLFYYKAELANTARGSLPDNYPNAGGTSSDRDRALIKAVGEAVERYSSALYFPEELIFGSYQSLSSKALAPERFNVYEKWQFDQVAMPLQPFVRDTSITWQYAQNLYNGRKVLIPAGMVYCPYKPDASREEPTVAENMSTGLAAHCSYEQAALNGIMEVVERDNFMITWLTKAKRPRIRLSSLTDLHQKLLERYQVLGYQIHLLNNTLDAGIPSIMAVMYSQVPGAVPFMVAAAAHPDPSTAVTKCIEELALMERYCKQIMDTETENEEELVPTAVIELKDHVKFWLDRRQLPKVSFLTAAKEQLDLEEIPGLATDQNARTIEIILDRIRQTGFEVYIADVTSADIEAMGIKVIRALIPGYLPLNRNYHCRPIGAPRLKPFVGQGGKKEQVNPFPHPFA